MPTTFFIKRQNDFNMINRREEKYEIPIMEKRNRNVIKRCISIIKRLGFCRRYRE